MVQHVWFRRECIQGLVQLVASTVEDGGLRLYGLERVQAFESRVKNLRCRAKTFGFMV